MRVLYIADALEPTSGSAYKVAAITGEWERQGHRVWLMTVRSPHPLPLEQVQQRLAGPAQPRGLRERVRGELAFRATYPAEFALTALRLGIDVIYSRGLPPAPGLAAMMRARPFVLEINGDVAQEIHQPRKRAARVAARTLQLRTADGVVFVSRELQRACLPEPRRALIMANPCLPAVEAQGEPPPRPERPTLAMIGYERHDWTGMDKVVELARMLPDLDFLVIGATVEGPENLRAVGPQNQAQADRLMRGCTLGLGPLALHRKGMFEASPLKSRNYLALGLPIVQAYEDTDLSEDDGCVLQLPNTADNVQLGAERIREFAWRAHRDPSLSQRARQLAEGRLSLAAKEAERLAFVETCVREHGR